MNSVPNSDSEQCTESKLSRVHSAPTLGPGCAQAARALRRVMARARPYRSPLPGHVVPVPECVVAVLLRTRACWRAVLPPPCRDTKLYRDAEAPAARIARHVAAHVVVSRPKKWPPTTIQFLYRDSPLARSCARALPHAPRIGRLCRRSYHGHLLAVSQACSAVSWPCPA